MRFDLQSIVFPVDAKHELCRELFFRESSGVVDRIQKKLRLSANSLYDFATYFNGCSAQKWIQYTYADAISVELKLSGKGTVRFVGYSFPQRQVDRIEFEDITYDFSESGSITYLYPKANALMLGFEILTETQGTFFGGSYYSEIEESNIRDCNLCIATTTCHKEDYIRKNVRMIKEEILSRKDIGNHVFIHVVDNGRSLTKEDISGYHVELHPNKNTGGAGGYARGMMESVHQSPKATHVLLMDDDIQVLPESIIRTYRLLQVIRPEYQSYFIGGAMLYYEQPYMQHEDIGFVRHDGIFESVKRKFDHRLLEDNLENEAPYIRQNNEYSAWWYCVIPAKTIENNGYPLPIFIRGDDIEYSLRCKSERITMNGICVWHLGFSAKFNYATDLYQQNRNLMIDKACSSILQTVDPLLFFKNTFQTMMLRFDYHAAEVVLRAMDDYLKGPEFIMKDHGEEILKQNSAMNYKMKPLDEVAFGLVLHPELCHIDAPRKTIDTFLRRLTYNGQRFWPAKLLRHDLPTVPLDRFHPAQKITLQENVLLINPYSQEGIILTSDKNQFKLLRKRYRNQMHQYKKKHKELELQYENLFPVLTSEQFWREYLELI